ncbi:MAG: hypothetical protein OEO77_02570 [Acidimicrobiia bacterium]|nr:hypothetical protein [Acidimicrobiia bacterium]
MGISSWGFKSPLAHDMFPERARRRRRRRLIIPAVVTLLIGVFWAAGSLRSDSIAATAFYDATRDIAGRQQATASSFQALATSAVMLDRAQYLAQLDQLQAAVFDGLVLLPAEEELPVETRGTLRLATRTLESWQAGLDEFKSASLLIVDEPANPIAVAELGDALGLLALGDALYRVLVDEMALLRADLDIAASEMPGIAFLPAGGTTPDFLGALVGRLQAAQDLVGRRGLLITNVVTVPAATGGLENGVQRLPFVEMLEVQVVVSNFGNLPEENLIVLVQLKSQLGNLLSQQTQQIPVLDTGAQLTVSFTDFEVVQGAFYEIVAGALTERTGGSPPPVTMEVFIAEEAVIPEG